MKLDGIDDRGGRAEHAFEVFLRGGYSDREGSYRQSLRNIEQIEAHLGAALHLDPARVALVIGRQEQWRRVLIANVRSRGGRDVHLKSFEPRDGRLYWSRCHKIGVG